MKVRIVISICLWVILQFHFSLLKAQIYTGGNGLTVSGTGTATKVELGGTLTKSTTIDLGATYQWSFLKGTTNYFSILNNGNVGIGTATPSTKLDVYDKSTIVPIIRLQDGDITTPDYSAVGFNPALTANTIAQFLPLSSTIGGVQLAGFSNTTDSRATSIIGYSGKTTVDKPVINFFARKHNGATNFTSLAATEPAFEFLNNATSLLRILGNGNVGIGITTPQGPLHILNNNNTQSILLESNSTGWGSGLILKNTTASTGRSYGIYSSAYGSLHIADNVAGVDRIYINNTGNVGIGTNTVYEKFQIGDRFTFHDGGWKKIGHNSYFDPAVPATRRIGNGPIAELSFTDNGEIVLGTGPNGSAGTTVSNYNYAMFIANNGNVGIGTGLVIPQAKLAVNGDIFSKKVKVTQTGWADYVFDENYELPSLKEVEKYIKANKHLPDVPSATEVIKNGLDLGDNQAVLLKKIEELTLYVIELNKKVKMLEAKENAKAGGEKNK